MEIEAPDGTVIEFPDDTPPDVVKGIMAKQFGGPQIPAPAEQPPAAPSVPVDHFGTALPAPAAQPQPEMGLTGRVARGMSQFNRALFEGATLGASGEALALADTATKGGTLERNLSRRDAGLNSVPNAIRVPGEVAGSIISGGLGGAGRNVLTRSMLPGGVYGFNATQGDMSDRVKGATLGAATAGIVDKSIGAIARVVSPQSSPKVQALREIGVEPTPGQALGGTARSIEEKLTSVPVLGGMIKRAEGRARDQFNIGAINKALAPAGLSLPKGTPPGREAVDAAMNLFDDAYSRAIPSGTRVPYNQPMRDQMEAISAEAADLLDDQGMKAVQRQIRKITQPGSSGGTSMTGERAKEIISELRTEARRYSSSQLVSEQNVGEVISQIEAAFNRQLRQSLPPESGAMLGSVDRAYANWKRLERAAASLGAEGGAFTPAQMQNAIRAMDNSANKRQFARGGALMQDVSEAGKTVLGSKVPNSGTADRGLLAAMLASGGGYAVDPALGMGIAAGIGAPSLAYSGVGQSLLAKLLTGRQGTGFKSAGEAIRRLGAPAGVGASVVTNR